MSEHKNEIASRLVQIEKRLKRRVHYEAELDEIIAQREQLYEQIGNQKYYEEYYRILDDTGNFEFDLQDVLQNVQASKQQQLEMQRLERKQKQVAARLFFDFELRREECEKWKQLWSNASKPSTQSKEREEVQELSRRFTKRYLLSLSDIDVDQRTYWEKVHSLFEESSEQKIERLEYELADLKRRCTCLKSSAELRESGWVMFQSEMQTKVKEE
jgi:hypothetical protein